MAQKYKKDEGYANQICFEINVSGFDSIKIPQRFKEEPKRQAEFEYGYNYLDKKLNFEARTPMESNEIYKIQKNEK